MNYATRPLGNRVLIRPEPQATETASGLALVQQWQPEMTGTVVAVGPTVKEPMAPEDYVIFSWQAGQEVFLDRERFLLLREEDVMAVIESKEMNGTHVA